MVLARTAAVDLGVCAPGTLGVRAPGAQAARGGGDQDGVEAGRAGRRAVAPEIGLRGRGEPHRHDGEEGASGSVTGIPELDALEPADERSAND